MALRDYIRKMVEGIMSSYSSGPGGLEVDVEGIKQELAPHGYTDWSELGRGSFGLALRCKKDHQ